MECGSIFILIWIGTAFWVLYDASNIGAGKGAPTGFFRSMGPGGWFFSCLLGWIIAFPAYLMLRDEIKATARGAGSGEQPTSPFPSHAPQPTSSTISDLARLSELREKGTISEEEFQTLKGNLLGGGGAIPAPTQPAPPAATQPPVFQAPTSTAQPSKGPNAYVIVFVVLGLIGLVGVTMVACPAIVSSSRNDKLYAKVVSSMVSNLAAESAMINDRLTEAAAGKPQPFDVVIKAVLAQPLCLEYKNPYSNNAPSFPAWGEATQPGQFTIQGRLESMSGSQVRVLAIRGYYREEGALKFREKTVQLD